MEEDYGKEVREFYNVYLPLQRRYNLQMYAHFSIWEDGWIKIYKKTGRQQNFHTDIFSNDVSRLIKKQ